MTLENTQDRDQPTSSEKTRETLRSIAADIDFKRFLEGVNGDSQRTRTVVFVLVAALLLIFTAYRNTAFPDWTDARLGRLQQAALCLETNLNSDECYASKQYAEGFLSLPGNEVGNLGGKELDLELREQINAFIKQRTDALSLRLPFFGITIDSNDLGLISGLLLIAILYVLFASLKSETDDLEIARDKAITLPDKKRQDTEKLLRMAQVLAPPSKSKLNVGQGLYVLYFLAPLLHFFVVKEDIRTYDIAVALEGSKWSNIDTSIDVVALLVVLAFSILCINQQRKLNHSLDDLIPE
jgi:hypothetical protein